MLLTTIRKHKYKAFSFLSREKLSKHKKGGVNDGKFSFI